MRLMVILEASVESNTLPGGVLLPVCGEPLLAAMLRRVRSTRVPFELCVATTTGAGDDAIAELCARTRVSCYRGNQIDLLERFYAAASAARAHAIAKLSSDCPLIDPAVIERVLLRYLSNADSVDFVGNRQPSTYPDGNDVEVMSMRALEVAYYEARRAVERECVTPFIWERPERFRLDSVSCEGNRDYSLSHRFRLQYAEDYQFVASVFEALGGSRARFGYGDILRLLSLRPELASLNARHLGNDSFRQRQHELKHVQWRDLARKVA
ncbi:MAG TPA: NTP transferase domain-containing protein [Polyangiaceae bacterium]